MKKAAAPTLASSKTIAELVAAVEGGDASASTMLFTSLYRELHRVAARELRSGASGAMLSATTLLHECYLGMSHRDLDFPDRSRFVAYAARAMRGLIVDYVRERQAQKRGGEFHLTALHTQAVEAVPSGAEMTRLHDALVDLQDTDAALAELVDLKFFCGFSFADIAIMRGVSERTVQRDWQKVRLLLHEMLTSD